MAATGDIAIDVSGVANTNPYDAPGVTEYGDPLRVFNGKFRVWDSGGFYTTVSPTSDTISAIIEIGSDNGDNFGPAIVNTSLNGWYLRCRFDRVDLLPILAGVGSVTGSEAILIVDTALATNDLVELEYNNTNGAIDVLLNGVSIGTTTNTTYSDLRSGYHFVASDYGDNGALSWAATGYSTGPTLSTVPATAFPGQSRTVTGSVFGATQGTGGVTIAGVAQTVTAWSDTSITFTTVQGNTKFGAGNALGVTTNAAQTANGTIELIVEPGTGGYVNVVDPATADPSSLAFGFEAAGGAPVATGDQCHYVYTGSPGDPASMTVEPDTLVSALDQEGTVDVRFWDATDSTWGSFAALNAAVPVVDTVKPVITILGDNPATVVVGNSYTDAGATASDNVDGGLGSVAGVGSVDTNTIGQYTITYPGAGVVDSAGNVADDATRIVNVVAELPTIDVKKKMNKRRRYTANLYGAWRSRFRGNDG